MKTTLIIMAAGIGSRVRNRNQTAGKDVGQRRDHHGLLDL